MDFRATTTTIGRTITDVRHDNYELKIFLDDGSLIVVTANQEQTMELDINIKEPE